LLQHRLPEVHAWLAGRLPPRRKVTGLATALVNLRPPRRIGKRTTRCAVRRPASGPRQQMDWT